MSVGPAADILLFQYSENPTIFPIEANRYHNLIKSTILFHPIHHLTSVIVTIKKPVHRHTFYVVDLLFIKITFVMN